MAAGIIAGLLLLGVIISPPWMPAERLTFTKASKDKPVVGYVLDQSQSGLTVLTVNPTQVLYYGPKDLTKEVACSAFRSDDLPIIYHTGLIKNLSPIQLPTLLRLPGSFLAWHIPKLTRIARASLSAAAR